MLTLGLTIVTILCKSTGALALLIVGMAFSWISRKMKTTLIFWPLILLPPTYVAVRYTGVWTGYEAVEIAKASVGEERAESLQYRLTCEDTLFTYIRKRPFFGWARAGGFNFNPKTKKIHVVIDGYYIIVMGESGVIGLTMFMSFMLLPLLLLIRRVPVKRWNDPEIAPVVGLSVMLALYLVDCLKQTRCTTRSTRSPRAPWSGCHSRVPENRSGNRSKTLAIQQAEDEATEREVLARVFSDQGRDIEAIGERMAALEIRDALLVEGAG